jgi:hypothetical protein
MRVHVALSALLLPILSDARYFLKWLWPSRDGRLSKRLELPPKVAPKYVCFWLDALRLAWKVLSIKTIFD